MSPGQEHRLEEIFNAACDLPALEQAAKELGVSVSTAERRWAYARAWLFREIRKGSPANGSMTVQER